MPAFSTELPPLDCHAHLAPDVTQKQIRALGGAVVFAVTRSLAEAELVAGRTDETLVWGCGVHPGVAKARQAFDEDRMRELLGNFALVGEVGLDRSAGRLDDQLRVFEGVLRAAQDSPVLVSVHSAGCTNQVVDLIERLPHSGLILHWFLGASTEVERATRAGCYFSVNSAMGEELLRCIPRDRMLPETDFPSTARRGGGRVPGDTSRLEQRIAAIQAEAAERVRWRWYRNLRALALASGAIDRFPDALADRLIAV